MTRMLALFRKELADLRANPGMFLPAVLTGVMSLVLPFFIAIAVPRLTGERLSDSADFELALEMYRIEPGTAGLAPEGAVQAWVFQQFLVLLVFAPVAGAMSIASHAIVGEKQARTLEPLLATPITTTELVGAKILGAFAPAIALALGSFVAYVGLQWLFADAGVYRTNFTLRALALVFIFGPMAALTALQLAVCVSSRVNDARSAQQIGALVILPLSALLVAQLTGSLQLRTTAILLAALGLLLANLVLLRVTITLFDRESILTRWK
jgi:ABC-2 type transport system permease protein